MKKIFLLLLIVPLTLLSQRSSAGLIIGKVVNSEDQPLEYVSVFLYNEQNKLVDGTLTDVNGIFKFAKLPLGTYAIETKLIGFKKKHITDIVLTSEKQVIRLGKIKIIADEKQLDEVVVQAEKQAIEYKIDKKVINVSREMQATGGSAVDVLRNVPSITVDVDDQVSLRGSSNFTVLIDGKPSILEGNDALEQIPASAIERVEIITNPSAKYDPDGVAGIINIITTKKHKAGLSGKIELSADNFFGYNSDILLQYRTPKIELVVEGRLFNRHHKMQTQNKRIFFNQNDTISMQEAEGYMDFNRQSKWAKFGISYFLNKQNTLTAKVSYGYRAFNSFNSTRTQDWQIPNAYLYQLSNSSLAGYTANSELDFEHIFDKSEHKITAYVQFSFWKPKRYNILSYDTNSVYIFRPTEDFLNLLNPYKEKTQEDRLNKKLRFQLDYQLPINEKQRFEAGISARIMSTEYSFGYYIFNNTNNTWFNVPTFNAFLDMHREIYAAYLTYSNQFNWLGVKLGLRTEYTNRLMQDLQLNNYPYRKIDVFPTLHLSTSLPHQQQIQLGYSRRINRPRGWFLNPSLRYYDKYSLQQGNPGLKPEYADLIELNYIKNFGRNFFSVETYYRNTNNSIDRVQRIDDSLLIFTWDNIDKNIAAGIELMVNISFFKIFNLNLATDGYYNRIIGDYDSIAVDRSSYTWNGRINIMARLPYKFRVQIGGFYRAKSLALQGYREPFFMNFAALSKSLFKNKLKITFNTRNFLNTARFAMINSTLNFYSYTSMAMLPYYSLSITYRINNYKQPKRQNNEMSEDDFSEGEY